MDDGLEKNPHSVLSHLAAEALKARKNGKSERAKKYLSPFQSSQKNTKKLGVKAGRMKKVEVIRSFLPDRTMVKWFSKLKVLIAYKFSPS